MELQNSHPEVSSLPTKNREKPGEYKRLRKLFLESPIYLRVLTYIAGEPERRKSEIKSAFTDLSCDLNDILENMVSLGYITNVNNVYSFNSEVIKSQPQSIDFNEFGKIHTIECASNSLIDAANNFWRKNNDYFAKHVALLAEEDMKSFFKEYEELLGKYAVISKDKKKERNLYELVISGINYVDGGPENV